MNDRFWPKVENASGADCWQWLGCTDKNGYGYFGIKRNGKFATAEAHRIAWELRRGPIPEGMCVCHHCDNPGCCNPSHLFVGTPADNVADMDIKGRRKQPITLGEKNGMHKLSWNSVSLIRLFATAGASYPFIAKRYGVTPQAVGGVVRGKTWRESEDELRVMEAYVAAMYEGAA
jgi:hypothetical protein